MESAQEQLIKAVVENDVNELKRLIAAGVDLNARCDQGASLLFAAVLGSHPELVRLMLENGADPNLIADEPAATIYTDKPLELARQARFLMDWDKYDLMVKLLVEFGATDSDGRTELSGDLTEIEMRARNWQATKQTR
ncbi:MAG TPA: ankyrin repeat domain-containing protein [Pyrinomonadaceae bacterium]|jgi:hypothetical protein|nr:ankyrin repeat domain-containing protein [Pyrinomonadaceae bacterium]